MISFLRRQILQPRTPRIGTVRTRMLCAAVVVCLAGCASGSKRLIQNEDAGALGDARPSPATPNDGSRDQADPAGDLWLRGARLPGGPPVDVQIRGDRIVAVQPAQAIYETPPADRALELTGRWLVPAFIDSHVHLSYWPVGEDLLRGGVIAVVDLAAPEASLAKPPGPASLRLLASGPMITAVGGYPLDSWGSEGYGTACTTVQEAVAAVDRLIDGGAGLIKLPLGQGRPLPDAVARAAIDQAHARGRKVAVHALSDEAAAQGARLGADVLAHTPVVPLSAATIEAWRGRYVISTLSAFGGSAATIANLAALRSAGVTVIYGTDLGNTRDASIDARELSLLARAGLDGAAIIEAATAAPARLWGWDDLGALEPGKVASLLVVPADPTSLPSTLAQPELVIISGSVLR